MTYRTTTALFEIVEGRSASSNSPLHLVETSCQPHLAALGSSPCMTNPQVRLVTSRLACSWTQPWQDGPAAA